MLRWYVTSVIALLLHVAPAMSNPALPEAVRTAVPSAMANGQATLRWFGLHIYDATLWTSGGRWAPEAPYALDIRYARSIAGNALADTSRQEIERLGWRDGAQLDRWTAQMRRIFPDVKSGSRLIGVSVPGKGARFYSDTEFLGAVDDPEFARAFFGIWLDSRTQKPDVRRALLGERS